MSKNLYNISLNQPEHQPSFPFFSIRLNKELYEKIKNNKDKICLKTTVRPNQFQLEIADQPFICTAHQEKSVDVLKYSRSAKAYYQVGPVQTKLSVEVGVSETQARGIREVTISSNIRDSKSKLLPDITPANAKRKREKSPTVTQKRTKVEQRSNSRSPKLVSASAIAKSPTLSGTHSDGQIPKRERRDPNEEKILNELKDIRIFKLTEDKGMQGLQFHGNLSSFTNVTSLESIKEYECAKKEYNTLFKDYTRMYTTFQNNNTLFDRLFKLYDSAPNAIKDQVESKIHQLHSLREPEQKKLASRYKVIHDQLLHLKKLLSNFQP